MELVIVEQQDGAPFNTNVKFCSVTKENFVQLKYLTTTCSFVE